MCASESDSCDFMLPPGLQTFKLAWLPSASRNGLLHHPNAAHLLRFDIAINTIRTDLGDRTFKITTE